MPEKQSAYRTHHSTETALLDVLSGACAAADAGQVTLLGLLDLSAAFDTIDHGILFIYFIYFQNSSGMQSVYNQYFKIHYIVSRKRLKGLSLVLAGS